MGTSTIVPIDWNKLPFVKHTTPSVITEAPVKTSVTVNQTSVIVGPAPYKSIFR